MNPVLARMPFLPPGGPSRILPGTEAARRPGASQAACGELGGGVARRPGRTAERAGRGPRPGEGVEERQCPRLVGAFHQHHSLAPSRSVRALRAVGLAAAVANSTAMAQETRFERRLDKWIARATTPKAAALVIATVTTSLTVVAGLLMTVIDHDNFPSLGGGLWWAVQTVTTVGYGDAVPESAGGQILAALVMLLGIGFITVITALITSTFVARLSRQPQATSDDPSAGQLTRIDERLERIEAALRERP